MHRWDRSGPDRRFSREEEVLVYRSDGVPVWAGEGSLGVIDGTGDMMSLVRLPIRPSGLSISSNDVLYVYESGPVSTVVRVNQNLDSLSTTNLPFRVNGLAHLNDRILPASEYKYGLWALTLCRSTLLTRN